MNSLYDPEPYDLEERHPLLLDFEGFDPDPHEFEELVIELLLPILIKSL